MLTDSYTNYLANLQCCFGQLGAEVANLIAIGSCDARSRIIDLKIFSAMMEMLRCFELQPEADVEDNQANCLTPEEMKCISQFLNKLCGTSYCVDFVLEQDAYTTEFIVNRSNNNPFTTANAILYIAQPTKTLSFLTITGTDTIDLVTELVSRINATNYISAEITYESANSSKFKLFAPKKTGETWNDWDAFLSISSAGGNIVVPTPSQEFNYGIGYARS